MEKRGDEEGHGDDGEEYDDDDDDDKSQPPTSLQSLRFQGVTSWKPLGAIAGHSGGHVAGLWSPDDALLGPS